MKLNKYLSDWKSGSDNKMLSTGNKIVFQNSTLDVIAKSLSGQYNTFINVNKSSKMKYTLTFENNDFDEVRKYALEHFGLKFEKSNLEYEFTYINFKK